jgi:hypothetical protein
MAGPAGSDKRQSFIVARQNDRHTRVSITSRNPEYNREQATKDLAEVDALITEGKFKRLKTAKGPGIKAFLYKFVLADGRRFRHGTDVALRPN